MKQSSLQQLIPHSQGGKKLQRQRKSLQNIRLLVHLCSECERLHTQEGERRVGKAQAGKAWKMHSQVHRRVQHRRTHACTHRCTRPRRHSPFYKSRKAHSEIRYQHTHVHSQAHTRVCSQAHTRMHTHMHTQVHTRVHSQAHTRATQAHTCMYSQVHTPKMTLTILQKQKSTQ